MSIIIVNRTKFETAHTHDRNLYVVSLSAIQGWSDDPLDKKNTPARLIGFLSKKAAVKYFKSEMSFIDCCINSNIRNYKFGGLPELIEMTPQQIGVLLSSQSSLPDSYKSMCSGVATLVDTVTARSIGLLLDVPVTLGETWTTHINNENHVLNAINNDSRDTIVSDTSYMIIDSNGFIIDYKLADKEYFE